MSYSSISIDELVRRWDRAPLPDLNMLDRDALVALIRAHQEELTAQQDELHSL
jgi:hypothetical protein